MWCLDNSLSMFKKKTQLSQAKAKEFSKWIKAFNVNFFLPKFKRNYLESPLDNKEIKPVHSKGNQPWIFIGRVDAEAEALILWPPDVKNQLTGKDPDAGKDWGQEEKGTVEDEMVGWHHWQWTWIWANTWEMVKDRETWCAVVHGAAKSDMTYWLNNNSNKWISLWYQILEIG